MDDNLDKKRKIPKLLLWCDFAVTEKFCEEKVQSIINNFTIHKAQWINAPNSCDQLEFMKSVFGNVLRYRKIPDLVDSTLK